MNTEDRSVEDSAMVVVCTSTLTAGDTKVLILTISDKEEGRK